MWIKCCKFCNDSFSWVCASAKNYIQWDNFSFLLQVHRQHLANLFQKCSSLLLAMLCCRFVYDDGECDFFSKNNNIHGHWCNTLISSPRMFVDSRMISHSARQSMRGGGKTMTRQNIQLQK